MSSKIHDAIVVGAGHNGLVLASYLCKAGMRDVLVLERREFVGGACITEELFPGFRFPACSYLCYLLQEKVIDELELRNYGFQVYHLEPKRFVPFPRNDQYICIWQDDDRTADEISRISKEDSRQYSKWMDFWRKAAGLLYSFFLKPPPTLSELVTKAKEIDREDILQRILVSSMQDLVEEYFEDENIKGYFLNAAQDLGDPSAPGTAFSATYFYCSEFTCPKNYGIVRGGMGGITQALERVAQHFGATVMKNAEVERILVIDGEARGVKLKDGRQFASDIVVSNADPKRTFLKLVGEDNFDRDFVKSVRRLKTNISYLKFHCCLERLPDFSRYLGPNHDPKILAQTKTTSTVESARKGWQDTVNGKPCKDPIMSLQIPSVYDDSLAPQGKHVMSVWSQYAPAHLRNGESWDEIREREGEFLIDFLQDNYTPNLRKVISKWSLFTPIDLEKKIYLTDGNIRHIDMIPGQLLSSRPLPGWSNYKTPIKRLYLCGAGTHPGGEVTGAPGHNAAQVILQDLEMKKDMFKFTP